MNQRIPAVFLDRDGTINLDHGYIHEIDDFQFIDGVIDACRELKNMGFTLILVTNQSGIARGKFTEEKFMHLTEWMDWSLEDRGASFDAVYFCPHHPDATISQYRKICDCRKPKPGMLLQAQYEFNIDMAASYMVGDTKEDMQAAMAVNVGTRVLVRTGKPITEKDQAVADWVLNSLSDLPDAIRARSTTTR